MSATKSKLKTVCKFCHRNVAEKAGRHGARQAARHYCPHGERCTGGEGPTWKDPRRAGSCPECMELRQSERTVAETRRVVSPKYGLVRLQAERVRCGKKACKKCEGVGHGPYWRGYATPTLLGSRTADMVAGHRPKRVIVYLGSDPSLENIEKRIAAKLKGKPKPRTKGKA